MRLACKFEELDESTRDYLHDVRSRKGKDTPGIFVAVGSMRPMLAVLIGPTVALVLFVISTASTKDAWAVAMLQTAALLIGVWAVVYACRRWFAGRSKTYGGKYVFFDSLHAYEVDGETVTITGLKTVREVIATHVPPRIHFGFKGDREELVAVPTVKEANLVSDYYEAMDELENSKRGNWSNVTAAELGAAAKFCVEEDETPRDVSELQLDIDEIPEEPKKARKAGLGLVPHLIILVSSSVVFFLLWQINKPIADNSAFENAKTDGAPGLRGYLLDERNTRHRDEAKTLLAAAYDPVISKLQAAPNGNNPKAREGMIELVKSLKTSDSPAVSLDVTEKINGMDSTQQGRATRLRTELADALARGVDPKLIAFAPPAEGKKPHINLHYEFIRDQAAVIDSYMIEIEIEFRTDIAAEPVVSVKWIEKLNPLVGLQQSEFETRGVEELKLRLSKELVGGFVPAPPPPPVMADDPDDF